MRNADRRLLIVVLLGWIASGCDHPARPTAAAGVVDVLEFLIGDAALWPRVGNHYSNQVVDWSRREVCWVKYANPRRFECWRWDDIYVYHATDNAVDGDTGESYHFTDGRWLPRHLSTNGGLEWTMDVPENRLIWFSPECAIDSTRSHDFPYRQRAWFEPQVDAGGDLGARDNLVLEYAPYDPATGQSNRERFHFARGAGWYRWERDGVDLEFNRRGGPVVPMDRRVWCGAI